MDPMLAALADEAGVASWYDDWSGARVDVDPEVVAETLAALGVDASDPRQALAAYRETQAAAGLPPFVAVTAGQDRQLCVPAGGGRATVLLEDGGRREWSLARGARTLTLPTDLPVGWHRLAVTVDGSAAEAPLLVAPARLTASESERLWGWQLQLYAVRSAGSWGVGDFADLRTIAEWSARQGAGALLVNPLHAPTPTLPLEVSPYFPSSRLFRHPLYLRVEETPEYAAAPRDVRARVDEIAARVRATNRSERLDRDAVWTAKLEAFQLLFAGASAAARARQLAEFRAACGVSLENYATYSALAERHGPAWQDWPEELRRPDSAAVAAARDRLGDRVTFHAWLQLLCDEQLAAVQRAATAGGMPVGVLHDLAVGVDPGGADAWALQDVLAVTTSVGAPPDSFNQQGQDWRLPPWRPDRLAAAGYAPFRDMVRAVLRHAGGVRIDHILGLFRLYWIPQGQPAARGAYVGYDDEALLGVLLLEAERAGALVVGEDLGTVGPRVARTLRERGLLGSDVLWFGRDEGGAWAPERYRALAAVSVTTHDLPTSRGFLAGEHVRVRAECGVLERSPEDEFAQARRERADLVALAQRLGLLGSDPTDDDVVVALHALLARTPARLALAFLPDAVGDLRQPNLPGTTTEYPSWRLPVADSDGRPVLLEEILASPLAGRIAAAMDRSNG